MLKMLKPGWLAKQVDSANKEFDALPEWMKHPSVTMKETKRFYIAKDSESDQHISASKVTNRRKTSV